MYRKRKNDCEHQRGWRVRNVVYVSGLILKVSVTVIWRGTRTKMKREEFHYQQLKININVVIKEVNIESLRQVLTDLTMNLLNYWTDFLCFFIFAWLLSRDQLFTRIFIFTIAGVKCCVAAVKSCPNFISVLYFLWSFVINDTNTFSIKNWIPLKSVLGGVRDVALFIISHEQTLWDS